MKASWDGALVNLFQFKLMRIIGKGSFGKVRMVERRETGKVYALKYISKAQVIKMEAVRNILRERQILESLDHCFMVNMRFAFQDDEYMYMCMDLMMGGDLRFHMNRRAFGEDVVRFWIAELCSAVNHLHSLGIVHRDIKPDNVLLDEKGHAHLTDFNIGCKLTPEKPILTSQSGTVAYMAPEVFKGTGYGTSVDWWAVGILFYECIYNKRPFQTENIPDLRRAIGNQTIEYPSQKGVSQDCVEVIQGFLTRDPNERLGTRGGMNGIRRQPFFQIEAYRCNMRPEQWWYFLETKQLTPVFQPPAEAANFDATYDLEEMLLEDDPLTYRSTRKRALRLHKEKMRAIRAEEERQRAAQEAAEAAEAEAQAAMEAMNRELEKSIRNIRGMSLPPEPRAPTPTPTPPVSKKKFHFGSGGGDQDTVQQVVQIPPPQPASNSMTQVSLSSEKSHTGSQVARQTQFQSIPLSPVDPSVGGRELPLVPVPAMRFPASTAGGDQYQPPPPPQNLNSLDHHPSSYYHRSSSPFSKPVVTTAAVTKPAPGNGYTHTTAGPGAGVGGGATAPGVTAVYLPKSTLIPKFGGGDAYDNDPTRDSGALAPSPLAPPAAIKHSISRQKHIPTQQALPPLLRHKSSQQQLPPRRPTTPTPVNIEAAAAAVAAAVAAANMTEEEKFAYQMDIIDREFTTFDYTIFENYHGLVDPVTMSVGDPPEWVRNTAEDVPELGEAVPRSSTDPIDSTDPDAKTTEKGKGPTKRATLTESQKYEVCAYMHDQFTTHATHLTNKAVVQYIESRYGLKVNESTVSRLRAQSSTRLAQGVTNPALKRHRAVMFPQLEARLAEFVKRFGQQQQGHLLTDPVIMAKAKELGRELGIEQEALRFSDGWLFKFKVRHGMKAAPGAAASGPGSSSSVVVPGTGLMTGGSGTGTAFTPPVVTPIVPAVAAAAATSGSAIPEQQQRQEQEQKPTRATRSKVKRQRVDDASGTGEGESPGDGVDGLNVGGINIEDITPTTATPAPKPRRKSNRKGAAVVVEDTTTVAVEDHTAVVSGRGRRKAGASLVSRNRDALSVSAAGQDEQQQQQLLDIGLDMDLDSHVGIEPDMDVDETGMEQHLSAAAAVRQQQQHVHSVAGAGGSSGTPGSDAVSCPVTQMEMLSKVYGTGSSLVMTPVEQQQHLSIEQQQQEHQQEQLQQQHQQQQHQQQTRQRTTRQHQQQQQQQQHQQQQQQPQQQAANDLMAGLTFNALNKTHKTTVPAHNTNGMDAPGHSIQTAATTAGSMPMSAAMAITASTAVPPTQSSLTGLGLTGTTSAVGAIESPPTVPHQHQQLHHPQEHQHLQHLQQQQQQQQVQGHPLRIPPPTTASRAALSLSMADPIAASFQPDPLIDFDEASQCVYTLRLFMQQQNFSRNQVDQLHAIYLTLDMKRKERAQQQQQQQQQQMKE
ncbi:hypothetical protein BG015_002336 [Linnemannia schmuckeri]|uniref:Uncharacterized protein n=1 Tax=Linnemannia schmuckeri TaxID=64567 RepID=A0A9P5VDK3_9FUNG|nr:hypothetical protein BG015_002336 [Linnemannia schmuckeri]